MANRSIQDQHESRLPRGQRLPVATVRKSGPRCPEGDLRVFGRLKRAVRKAERRSGDGCEIGGTGATILRFLAAPVVRLIEKKRIGTEEIRAADDIAMAFHAQAGPLMIKSPSFEKRDATYHGREPVWIIDAVSRYKRWACHWSQRAAMPWRMPTSASMAWNARSSITAAITISSVRSPCRARCDQ